jgi:hypothetical protein
MSKKIKIPLVNMRYALHDLFHEHLDEIYELRRICHRGRRSGYNWAEDEEVQWLMQQGVIFPGMEDDMANFYDDYDYDEDDADTIWPPTSSSFSGIGVPSKKKKHSLDPYGDYWNMVDELEKRKGKKKHKRGNKKGKTKIIDINTPYSGEEEDPDEIGEADYFDSSGIEDGKEIWFYPDYRDKHDRLEFNTLSDFSDFCADQGYHVEADVGMAIAYRRISHTCLDPVLRDEGVFQIIAEESYGDMRYAVTPVEELSQ